MKRPSGFDPKFTEAKKPAVPAAQAGAEQAAASRILAEEAAEQAASGSVPAAGVNAGKAKASAELEEITAAAGAAESKGPKEAAENAGTVENSETAEVLRLQQVQTDLARVSRLEKLQKRRLGRAKRTLKAAKQPLFAKLVSAWRALGAKTRQRLIAAGVCVSMLAVFAFLVAVASFTPIMSVRQISVSGLSEQHGAEVAEALEPLKGSALALVDRQDVHSLLTQFAYIESYTISRVPPSSLALEITERVPVLIIKRGSEFITVDAAGVELARSAEATSGLPVAESGNVTNTGHKAFRAAATVLREVPDSFREQIAQVRAGSGQDIEFQLHSGLVVRWGDSSESAMKLVLFEKMSAALSGQSVKLLDVSSIEAPVFE